jgi:hypothetical protein
MRSHGRSYGRRIAVLCCFAVGMLALQYVTVDTEDFGSVGHYGYGPAWWTIRTLSPITLVPLGPIARNSAWTDGRRWTGAVMRAFPRFKDHRAASLTFAVANTGCWLLGGWVVRLCWLGGRKFLRRRTRGTAGVRS